MLACMGFGASAGDPPVLLPYGRRPAAQVDVHTACTADQTVRIQLTLYPVTAELPQAPEIRHRAAYLPPGPCELTLARLSQTSRRGAAESASVVSTRSLGRPANLVLDGLMSAFPGCWIASVFEPGRCLVAVRTNLPHEDVPHGYQFVLTPEQPDAPSPMWLYGSAVYGWARWRLEETRRLDNRQPLVNELPAPPDRLVLAGSEDEQPLRISDVERASWPPLPDRPMSWWNDLPEERKASIRQQMNKPGNWTPPRRDGPDPTEER